MTTKIDEQQKAELSIARKSAFLSECESKAQSFLAARAIWFIFFSGAAYLGLACWSAVHHKLWFDEVNTALLAPLPFARLWQALSAGADTNPPLLYLPVRFLGLFTSNIELSTRLPVILEFLLMMGCLYAIARRYVSSIYALTAALLPFLTPAAVYVTEGRGYAAMLGFCTAALLCWRNAALGIRRKSSLVLLALSIGLAVSNHYSATVIFVPLFVGEASKTLVKRKLDLSVWIAMGLGGLPLLLYRPLMPAIHRYLIHYWSKPSLREVFVSLLGWKWVFGLILLFVCMSLLRDILPTWMRARNVRDLHIPRYEYIAWMTLLCSPIYGYLQGKVTGGFSMRYVIVMAMPAALFTAILAYRSLRGATLPAMLIWAVTMCFMAERLIVPVYRPIPSEQQSIWITKQATAVSGPVVIGDPVVFSPMYFYATAPLRDKLRYLTDPDLSVKFLGADSADLNLHLLRNFSPMPVLTYSTFVSRTKHFFVAEDENAWIRHQLPAQNARVKHVSCKDTWCFDEVWMQE